MGALSWVLPRFHSFHFCFCFSFRLSFTFSFPLAFFALLLQVFRLLFIIIVFLSFIPFLCAAQPLPHCSLHLKYKVCTLTSVTEKIMHHLIPCSAILIRGRWLGASPRDRCRNFVAPPSRGRWRPALPHRIPPAYSRAARDPAKRSGT